MADVTGGSDTFTFLQANIDSHSLVDTGSNENIIDVGSDSYYLTMTGTEILGRVARSPAAATGSPGSRAIPTATPWVDENDAFSAEIGLAKSEKFVRLYPLWEGALCYGWSRTPCHVPKQATRKRNVSQPGAGAGTVFRAQPRSLEGKLPGAAATAQGISHRFAGLASVARSVACQGGGP